MTQHCLDSSDCNALCFVSTIKRCLPRLKIFSLFQQNGFFKLEPSLCILVSQARTCLGLFLHLICETLLITNRCYQIPVQVNHLFRRIYEQHSVHLTKTILLKLFHCLQINCQSLNQVQLEYFNNYAKGIASLTVNVSFILKFCHFLSSLFRFH